MGTIQRTAAAWLESRFGRAADSGGSEALAGLADVVAPRDPAVRQLVRIVLGAEAPERFDVMPESAGLRAMLGGLFTMGLSHDETEVRAGAVLDAMLASLRRRVADGEALESDPLLDPVSGLPNRLLFLDRLLQAIAYAHRHDMLLAVCSVRADLSECEATAGRVVLEIAARLRERIRELDTISRLAFDEFGVVLNDLRNRGNAMVAVEKIEELFWQPFDTGGESCVVRPRIGMSFYPAHGHDAAVLLDAARQAVPAETPVAVFGER